jgi:hypothetical protein
MICRLSDSIVSTVNLQRVKNNNEWQMEKEFGKKNVISA